MTFYHFFPCPLLSRAPLNKHFLDTCCFNNLDNMVTLLGTKGLLHRWFFTCKFYLYFYAIQFKSK